MNLAELPCTKDKNVFLSYSILGWQTQKLHQTCLESLFSSSLRADLLISFSEDNQKIGMLVSTRSQEPEKLLNLQKWYLALSLSVGSQMRWQSVGFVCMKPDSSAFVRLVRMKPCCDLLATLDGDLVPSDPSYLDGTCLADYNEGTFSSAEGRFMVCRYAEMTFCAHKFTKIHFGLMQVDRVWKWPVSQE